MSGRAVERTCQDLAGSWYAQHEHSGCGCKGSVASMVLWFRGEHSSSRETEVERESLGLQVKDEDKTEV